MLASLTPLHAADKWPAPVAQAITRAGSNQAEIKVALRTVPPAQREGMEFLVANMPDEDLRTLSSKFLVNNVALAYQAWQEAHWKASVPKELFFNDVLPYASLTEAREDFRGQLRQKSLPLINGCKTPGEAAMRLNDKLFPLVNVRYSTERQRPDQSPQESMASGKASCSGLSILLVDACRAVGIPARVVGTPLWANMRGNHTWVEIWDGGWHFVGASEPDAQGLDHAWFTHDASEATQDDPLHAIYATSFQKTGLAFPLVWAMDNHSVPAVNVTDRYAAPVATPGKTRMLVQVLGPDGKRVAADVAVRSVPDNQRIGAGVSRDESADMNDMAAFPVPQSQAYEIAVDYAGQTARQTVQIGTDAQQVVVVNMISMNGRRGPLASNNGGTGKSRGTTLAPPLLGAGGPPKPLSPASVKALNKALTEYFAASADKQSHWMFPANLDALLRKNEGAVRAAAWNAYRAAPIHGDAKQDFDTHQVRFGQYLSPYTIKTVGTRPARGWGLVIAMHGGGGAPKELNDEQWQEMQVYYRDHPENGGYRYLALRAPNDTWNGFYDDYVYPLIGNLVKQNLLFGDVDPNKVFLIGYSHGGYGAFAIGPKEPDLFAAIHASAAAPTDGETTAKTLRNTIFSVWVGDHDTMYGRLDRDKKFAAEVQTLRGNRSDIYPVAVEIKEGHGHSDLPDRDFLAGMTAAVRNPVPRELSWLMTDSVITDFFWLQTSQPGKEKEIDATCVDNKITVTTTPTVAAATLLLDSRLIDFSKPVTFTVNGKASEITLTPSLHTLCETLQQRGDPNRAFTAKIALAL